MQATRIGEVVQVSTQEFAAQCYELHQPPPFASLVRTREGETDIFAVVYHAETGPLEPGRRPVARGREETEEEGVYRSHPQLSRLLRTEFRAWIVGHRVEGKLVQALSPRPPKLHSFVYLAKTDEIGEFGSSLHFLGPLATAPLPSREELIPAFLLHLAGSREDREEFLLRAGKELTLLLRGDAPRLQSLLRRLS
ncbi:MAG: hypothetical protein ABIG98_04325 [Chloroflexota bacterium]